MHSLMNLGCSSFESNWLFLCESSYCVCGMIYFSWYTWSSIIHHSQIKVVDSCLYDGVSSRVPVPADCQFRCYSENRRRRCRRTDGLAPSDFCEKIPKIQNEQIFIHIFNLKSWTVQKISRIFPSPHQPVLVQFLQFHKTIYLNSAELIKIVWLLHVNILSQKGLLLFDGH